MKLVAYLKTGPTSAHAGGWRDPDAALHDVFDPQRYEDLARTLEAARFDAAFFVDTFGIPDVYRGSFRTYVQRGGQISYLDPMLVLPLMARVTTHLGLGATLSTTFHPPYLLARMLASFDLLSGGRAAWNIVTSATEMEARNFGMDALPGKDARYDQADEVLQACNALWECWDEDALVLDKAGGVFADPDKVRYADFVGRFVRTRGPLTIPRSPQVRPVFLQASASPRGRDFAARWAEVIFAATLDKGSSVAFATDMRRRMAGYGRAPETCAVLNPLAVTVGATDAEAREKRDALDALADGELVLAHNSTMVGADLSRHRTGRRGRRRPRHDRHRRHRRRDPTGGRRGRDQLRRRRQPPAPRAVRHRHLHRRPDAGSVRGGRLRRLHRLGHGVTDHVSGIRPPDRSGTPAPRPGADRIRSRHAP